MSEAGNAYANTGAVMRTTETAVAICMNLRIELQTGSDWTRSVHQPITTYAAYFVEDAIEKAIDANTGSGSQR